METMTVNGLALFYDIEERDAAELVGQACERSIRLIREHWGLETPEECRVYVMASWMRFMFHSAPWSWRMLMGVSLPLWYFRIRKLWQYAGGWTQGYGRRQAVGVKPPRLIHAGDRSIGDRIFIQEDDIDAKVQHVTCHELTHACTAHLKLPAWLNEGLAMITVDRFFEQPTVIHETLETLEKASPEMSPERDRRFTLKDQDAVVYLYVRGYWLTRYVEDTRPGLLKRLLPKRLHHRALETEVASAYDMTHEVFWSDIDRMAAAHFR
jgi:hypothetical protein